MYLEMLPANKNYYLTHRYLNLDVSINPGGSFDVNGTWSEAGANSNNEDSTLRRLDEKAAPEADQVMYIMK